MPGSASTVELLLGLAWVPVGFVVRSGGPTGRTVGLVAGALTTLIGAGVLLSGQGYFVGTITAMFLVARLLQNKDAFATPSQPEGALGQHAPFGQPPFGQPQYGQAQPGPAASAEPDWGYYATPPRDNG